MEVVRSIAIERIVDTEAHKTVEQYIENFMAQHAPNWRFEKDEFMDETPLGSKIFTNLIATLDAVSGTVSDKYLVLAAHYDSKIISGQKFEAAIDSAVPCAILLQFARYFNQIAPKGTLEGKNGHNWGIKIVFFDGEEAFHEWTPTDSIYGSRHLAQDWASGSEDLLDKINLFVLLDLLGAPNMTPIPSRYVATNRQFQFFVDAQTASKSAGLIPSKVSYFSPSPQPSVTIEDDHIPWLRRGVPVVHLIPAPFPRVWHTSMDTVANLDPTAVTHLTALIHLAAVNYLETN
jgi:glutaminyl-peptide cyclotransferase